MEFASEEKIGFTQATKSRQFPKRPALSTLHRWADRGVRGVKLESEWFGNRRVTSEGAIERFNSAVNTSKAERAEAQLVADDC